jgi:acyl carrier protein
VSGSIPQDVRDESHFLNDLYMDDLDVMEVLTELETALDVVFEEDQYKTFGELVTAACKAKGVDHE